MIEAFLLTGGGGKRMGRDKASLPIDGVPMAERIALALGGLPVTVLGRSAIEGFDFLPDAEEFQGPAVALSRAKPKRELVFVVACDLPRFDARIVALLESHLGGSEAAVPLVGGKLQPLCALYRERAFERLIGCRSMMAWLDRLNVVAVEESEIWKEGIDPASLRGANKPSELG
jgi:molybdopterin-guanine dinucleotide biosynthesis protein A